MRVLLSLVILLAACNMNSPVDECAARRCEASCSEASTVDHGDPLRRLQCIRCLVDCAQEHP